MEWLQAMPANRRRGSCPRCLLLLQGDREDVARRLTATIGLPEVHVAADDRWMPRGLRAEPVDAQWDRSCLDEARLGECEGLLSSGERRAVTEWWLTVIPHANTPNWDIASTCMIAGKKGVLLVEAKAHDMELRAEEKGKTPPEARTNSLRNHARIGWCIEDASIALSGDTSLPWSLSRDHHYQMCNRFAWAWKLTELGYPVVLMYLGFLHAAEMRDRGRPFSSHDDWERLVIDHSASLCPPTLWQQQWAVSGQVFVPIIRSVEQPLTVALPRDVE